MCTCVCEADKTASVIKILAKAVNKSAFEGHIGHNALSGAENIISQAINRFLTNILRHI